jgi:hypothetical protein
VRGTRSCGVSIYKRATDAIHRKADICLRWNIGRYGPLSALSTCSKKHLCLTLIFDHTHFSV